MSLSDAAHTLTTLYVDGLRKLQNFADERGLDITLNFAVPPYPKKLAELLGEFEPHSSNESNDLLSLHSDIEEPTTEPSSDMIESKLTSEHNTDESSPRSVSESVSSSICSPSPTSPPQRHLSFSPQTSPICDNFPPPQPETPINPQPRPLPTPKSILPTAVTLASPRKALSSSRLPNPSKPKRIRVAALEQASKVAEQEAKRKAEQEARKLRMKERERVHLNQKTTNPATPRDPSRLAMSSKAVKKPIKKVRPVRPFVPTTQDKFTAVTETNSNAGFQIEPEKKKHYNSLLNKMREERDKSQLSKEPESSQSKPSSLNYNDSQKIPGWAIDPELRNLLLLQCEVDATGVFGSFESPDMHDFFGENLHVSPSRLSKTLSHMVVQSSPLLTRKR
ncbi:hypothetical protein GEMRC1_007363 [Eukaryota sp. GEM-RC1]